MNAGAKLAAYGAAVTIVFGGAAAVGATVGPIDVRGDDHATMDGPSGQGSGSDLPRGLAIAAEGYRLVLGTERVTAGVPSTLAFSIVGDHGDRVIEFDELHERRLHLIVLSRDLVGFHHLHPIMDDSGEWTVALPALAPGSHRVFADFTPTGEGNLTLGADLDIAGTVGVTAVPEPTDEFVVDGYTVTMQGTPQVGEAALRFSVSRAGQALATEPYLGAAGHLVAIRAGDLAYLHVHPHGDSGADIRFDAEFPSAGTYRLFLDFAHEGVVRTAAFTVTVSDGGNADAPTTTHAGGH